MTGPDADGLPVVTRPFLARPRDLLSRSTNLLSVNRELELWVNTGRVPLWYTGAEYIGQEGTNFWTLIREKHDLRRIDVYDLSDYVLPEPAQALFEDHCYMPDLAQLEVLALIYGMKPGELLDACYEYEARRIQEGDEA
jgi:hypothetical protein